MDKHIQNLTEIHTLSLFGMLGRNRRIIGHDNHLRKGFNIEAGLHITRVVMACMLDVNHDL